MRVTSVTQSRLPPVPALPAPERRAPNRNCERTPGTEKREETIATDAPRRPGRRRNETITWARRSAMNLAGA